MPRPWRTVHRSRHKIVMVKPRPDRPHRHHHTTNRVTHTTHVQKDMDLSWLWPVAQLIFAVIVICFTIDLLIGAWPYLLAAAIIFLIIA